MEGNDGRFISPVVKVETSKEMIPDYGDFGNAKIEPSDFLEVGLIVKQEPEDDSLYDIEIKQEVEDYNAIEYSEELVVNPKAVLSKCSNFEVREPSYIPITSIIKPCYVSVHNSIDSIDLSNCGICKAWREARNNRIEYECDMCLKKFTNKLGLRVHIWHHLNPQVKITNKAKAKEKDVKREDEEDDLIECYYCNASFENQDDLDNHIKGHKETKLFECMWCKEKFRTQHFLKKHECSDRKKILYECNMCDQIFFDSVKLENHRNAHLLNMFDCEICGKYFYYKSDMARHMVVHNKPRQLQCSFCPKKYSTKNYLMEHEKNHLGIKRFNCDICGKNYFWESQFKRHLDGARHLKMLQIKAQTIMNQSDVKQN